MWQALLPLAGSMINTAATGQQASANRRLTERQMAEQRRQFDVQMNSSIQRRVKDAQEAGIHPLFALGASVGASPTASIGGQQPVHGSAVGKALSALGTDLVRGEIAKRSSAAKRDEAEAALLDAQRARLEQEVSGPRGRDGISVNWSRQPVPPGERLPDVTYGNPELVAPPQVLSKSPGTAAGTNPSHEDFYVPGLGKIRILSSGLQADEIKQIDYTIKVLARAFTTGSMKLFEATRKRLQDMLGRRLQYRGKDRVYGVTSPRGGPG